MGSGFIGGGGGGDSGKDFCLMGQPELGSSNRLLFSFMSCGFLGGGGVSVFISGREVVSEYGSSTSGTHATWNLQTQMCWLVPEGLNTTPVVGSGYQCVSTLFRRLQYTAMFL